MIYPLQIPEAKILKHDGQTLPDVVSKYNMLREVYNLYEADHSSHKKWQTANFRVKFKIFC